MTNFQEDICAIWPQAAMRFSEDMRNPKLNITFLANQTGLSRTTVRKIIKSGSMSEKEAKAFNAAHESNYFDKFVEVKEKRKKTGAYLNTKNSDKSKKIREYLTGIGLCQENDTIDTIADKTGFHRNTVFKWFTTGKISDNSAERLEILSSKSDFDTRKGM